MMSVFRPAFVGRIVALARFQPCRLVNARLSGNVQSKSPDGQDHAEGQRAQAHSAECSSGESKPLGKETEDVMQKLQLLQSENERLISAHSELEDKYKRSLAEADNVRKRLTKQIEDAKMFGVQKFCKDLLEVADVLTKATESVPADALKPGANPEFLSLYEGLKMTEQQMLKVFARHQLVRIIPAEGDAFDPNFHEALFLAPIKEGKKPNTIATVTKVGYKLYDRTLRPAYVTVFGS
ncbi:unnamed protein product [Calicophoron daubneyi]|uniref:GrpE protein homolog n=1 Tax=Calicophoron daubneyi TaxID=300641 RepID=A0AAV2T342_CALDB